MDQNKRRVLIIGGLMIGAILLLLWVVNRKGSAGSSSGQTGYGGTIYWGGMGAPSDIYINRTTTINNPAWTEKPHRSPTSTGPTQPAITSSNTTWDRDKDKATTVTRFAGPVTDPSLYKFEIPPSAGHHGPAGVLHEQHLSTASHKGA